MKIEEIPTDVLKTILKANSRAHSKSYSMGIIVEELLRRSMFKHEP